MMFKYRVGCLIRCYQGKKRFNPKEVGAVIELFDEIYMEV